MPRKNVHPLLGLPLIAHLGRLVPDVPEIDRTVVSTDDDEIATIAELHGLEAPFRRPADLSGDRVGDREVLRHALDEVERGEGRSYDVVVMLQPTSPLRRPAHVRATIRALVDASRDAVWTVSPTDSKHHPLKQLVCDDEGRLSYWDERGASIIARQQLRPVHHRNGAAYAFTRACLMEGEPLLTENTGAIIIDEPMISIDTLEDFAAAERVLRERGAAGHAGAGG